MIGWLLKMLTQRSSDPRPKSEKKLDWRFADVEPAVPVHKKIITPDKRRFATFPPNDQGRMGSCWGMAGANAVETLINEQRGIGGIDGIRLSPLYVYKLAEAIDQHDAQGTYGWAVMHTLLKYGVCEEKFMPYHDNFNQMLQQPIPPDAYENAKQYKIRAYYRIDNKKAEEQIRKALSTPGLMVCLNLNIHSGWVPMVTAYGYPPAGKIFWKGGHAMACDGIYFLQNSWGLGGDGTGHVEITPLYLTKCLIEGYVIEK